MRAKRFLLASMAMLLPLITNAQTRASGDGISYLFYTEQTETQHITVFYGPKTAVVDGSRQECEFIPSTIDGYDVIAVCGWGGKKIMIPKNVKYIGDYVLDRTEWDTYLDYDIFPIYGEAIDVETDYYEIKSCQYNPFSELEKISVEEGHPCFDSRNNCNAVVETKTNTLLYGCVNTVIPENVESIGDYAFQNCNGMTSIKIPSGIENIGIHSFDDCENLSSIEFDCKKIPNRFSGINTLRNIHFLENVTTIDDGAFSSCKNIEKIVFGKSVSSVGERAFANIDKLSEVYCYAENVPTTDRTTFENSYVNYVTLYVPVGSIEKYKATAPWSGFKSIIPISDTSVTKPKCATPSVVEKDGKFSFSCKTEGVKYVYKISRTGKVDAGETFSPSIKLLEPSSKYTLKVYASKTDYTDSDAVYVDFVIDKDVRGDVNSDGMVNVADIVSVTNMIIGK